MDIKILKDEITSLKEENISLREEIANLQKEIENTKCPYDTKMLIRTVKALNKSISDGIILSDDKSQAIQPLLELIMEFNNIQEDKE